MIWRRTVAFLFCLHVLSSAFAAEWMRFPEYRRTVLPNGITLLLIENHEAPLISLDLGLRTGSVQDPAGQDGLADLTNDLLRKGAGARTADQIADELDFIGATLSTWAPLEMTRLHAEFLKKDLSTGVELFADLVLRPTFPEAEVAKLQKQRVDQLRSQKDQPLEVIRNYQRRFLFGAHPYGRSPGGDEETVARIKREDVVRFYKDTYVSSNMIIAAAGSFKADEMEKILARTFGSLAPKAAPDTILPSRPAPSGRRVLLVDKPDSTQSFFCLGHFGLAINDPDRVAVQLINTLFGGRFTSRLNNTLRVESGLTYGASSQFDHLRQPGDFNIITFTRNETTSKTLDTTLDILKKLHANGITAEELASAKTYIKGQFGPSLETAEQVADRLVSFEIYGLDPKVEVDQFADRLDAITIEETKRLIKKAFPLENLSVTIIGKASEVSPVLKTFAAEIQSCSISAPGYAGPSQK